MNKLIRGIIRNCENCFSSYGQYGKPQYSEYWCLLSLKDESGEIIKPEGLCQFCNPKTPYYNKQNKQNK